MGNLSTQVPKNSLIGQQATDIVLGKSDGTTSSVLASRGGKKAILVFWASWCPHCYQELGNINDNLASIEHTGVNVILVDVGETKGEVNSYFDRRQMKLVSFIDGDSALQDPYHLIGVPTMVFIDDKGIIKNVTNEFPLDYENYFNSAGA